MITTSSQVYGSHYKNNPQYSIEKRRNSAAEAELRRHTDLRSLSPVKLQPTVTSSTIIPDVKNQIALKGEETGSPFIQGKRNREFIHRSLVSCDALVAPNYEGGANLNLSYDVSRYQPYKSPPKKVQKGLTPKIGHEDRGELTGRKQTPEPKLPWHREEPPKRAARRLEFENQANFQTPAKKMPEIENTQATQIEIQAEPSIELARPKPAPQKLDHPNHIGRSASTPKLELASTKNLANTYQSEAITDAPKNIENRVFEAEQKPGAELQETLPKPIEVKAEKAQPDRSRSLSRSQSQPPYAILPDKAVPKATGRPLTSNQSFLREERMRPQTSAGVFGSKVLSTLPQEKSAEAKAIVTQEEKISQPQTPASVHSHGSRSSNASGKDLICEICVNKNLKRTKDFELAIQREEDKKREQEEFAKAAYMAEQDRERARRKREEVQGGLSQAIEENEKKFQEYWHQRRIASLAGSEENKRREEKMAQEKREAYNIYKKYQEELKSSLLGQMREKEEAREFEKQLSHAPNQKTSLTLSSGYSNPLIPTAEEVRRDQLRQMEEKREKLQQEYQEEKVKAESEKARMERIQREERELAIYHREKSKDELRRAYEEGILEQKARKEQEIAEKKGQREQILKQQEIYRQSDEQNRRSRKDFASAYVRALERQIADNERSRDEERTRSKEPYDTSIGGFHEYPPKNDPNYYENLMKQSRAYQAQVRQEYEEQIAEKKRQQEQERLENLSYKKTGLEVSGFYHNPHLKLPKPLTEILADQIKEKEIQRVQQQESEKKAAREQQEIMARTEQELRKALLENQHRLREELRKGYEEGINFKQMEKEAAISQKLLDKIKMEEATSLANASVYEKILRKNEILKEHAKMLAAQIADEKVNKAREKELQQTPYDTTLSAIVNKDYSCKLYSCMECTRKFPKAQMTKKSALASPQKVPWQKF